MAQQTFATLERFLRIEAVSGVVLLLAAAVAPAATLPEGRRGVKGARAAVVATQ